MRGRGRRLDGVRMLIMRDGDEVRDWGGKEKEEGDVVGGWH